MLAQKSKELRIMWALETLLSRLIYLLTTDSLNSHLHIFAKMVFMQFTWFFFSIFANS